MWLLKLVALHAKPVTMLCIAWYVTAAHNDPFHDSTVIVVANITFDLGKRCHSAMLAFRGISGPQIGSVCPRCHLLASVVWMRMGD
uniref:Putative secreted protein n=1 Tax=Ixodes scapularis TaxID=6945 RepID=A0A4D5RC59_IXOSC